MGEHDDFVTAVPIRYMVTSSRFGMKYYVIDTSIEGHGGIIARCDKLDDAGRICQALNEVFGHPQGSGVA